MFYNFIGNGNNFLFGLPLNLYFYCKQTTRKCEGLLMHSTINTSNKELCIKSPSHLRVYNLLQLQGNINIFLPEIPLKVEKFYSVEYHLNYVLIPMLKDTIYFSTSGVSFHSGSSSSNSLPFLFINITLSIHLWLLLHIPNIYYRHYINHYCKSIYEAEHSRPRPHQIKLADVFMLQLIDRKTT